MSRCGQRLTFDKAQLYWRNEGRQTVLLALCAGLSFFDAGFRPATCLWTVLLAELCSDGLVHLVFTAAEHMSYGTLSASNWCQGRQLLFRALKGVDGVDNSDFDDKAVQLYEDHARRHSELLTAADMISC